jgi:hypothetical protein
MNRDRARTLLLHAWKESATAGSFVAESRRRGMRLLFLTSLLWGLFAGSAGAVEVGEKAPDFVLAGTPAAPVRLSHYLANRVVVLHFYLGDFLDA